MTKKHYHLVAGEVFYVQNGENSELSSSKLNTYITTDTAAVPAKALAKATTALQMNLHQRAGGDHLNIVDVYLVSVSYLGEFTEDEFTDGMGVQPVAA